MKKHLTLGAALCVSTALGTAALAEYPERPVEMIVAFSAGGGTDVAARTLAPYVEKYLGDGASITVINKPGAGGEIGFTKMMRADADGYTIGFVNTPHLLTHPISRETRYTLDDMQPVANVIYDPGAFSVRPDAEFQTLEELVAYAKEHPGEVSYGTTGAGGDDHLAAVSFERQAGIELSHIPFSGASDVRAAVLGGHIDMASMNVTEALSDAQDGRLVMLGQMAEERWKGAPDIPTFKEQGYDVLMGSNRGIGAPAGIPDEALQALEGAIAQAIEDPEFQAAAEKQQLALSYQDAATFEETLQGLDSSLRQLWREDPWIE